tara:strand:- start:224 stop:415 length:192 start_codon:yes stop_codon:yes gene_type:complete
MKTLRYIILLLIGWLFVYLLIAFHLNGNLNVHTWPIEAKLATIFYGTVMLFLFVFLSLNLEEE